MDLFNGIIDQKRKKRLETHVAFLVEISEPFNKAIIKYQESEGMNKRAAVEVLVMNALKHLNLLDVNEQPCTPPTNGTGRDSYKEGTVKISGKMTLNTHNALMRYKLESDLELRYDPKPVIIQKLLVIGLRLAEIPII